ncbi:MAG: pyridoxamine 5'-phosphate oxidase family protein [Bacteroidota bacterium]
MTNENNFPFIKERIAEIGSAIIYSMSNELITVPATIINILKIDDDGQLWFFINRPSRVMHDAEKKFPARLQFYRKGKPFYLKVSGCAGIDEDPDMFNQLSDDIKTNESSEAKQNMILVKLKITRVEYHEQKQLQPNRGIFQKALQYVYAYLFKPSHYYYQPLEINPELA